MTAYKSIILTLSLTLFACAQTPYAQSEQADVKPLSFVVMGDAPYDDEQRVMLKQAAAKIKLDEIPFVIHLGDYKGGGSIAMRVMIKSFLI